MGLIVAPRKKSGNRAAILLVSVLMRRLSDVVRHILLPKVWWALTRSGCKGQACLAGKCEPISGIHGQRAGREGMALRAADYLRRLGLPAVSLRFAKFIQGHQKTKFSTVTTPAEIDVDDVLVIPDAVAETR